MCVILQYMTNMRGHSEVVVRVSPSAILQYVMGIVLHIVMRVVLYIVMCIVLYIIMCITLHYMTNMRGHSGVAVGVSLDVISLCCELCIRNSKYFIFNTV